MRHASEFFNYANVDSVQILQLSYEEDISMLVILPDDSSGISDLEESLSAVMVNQWRNALQNTLLNVDIPKFEIRANYDLIDPLSKMGMSNVFNAKAHLQGIVDANQMPGNIYVDKATQDAYVKVNEKGTEAMAVTLLEIPSTGPPTFNANHPFLFLIQDDQSGVILFMGKIVDPTAE